MKQFRAWLVLAVWSLAPAFLSLTAYALLQMDHNIERVRQGVWPGVAMAFGLLVFVAGLAWLAGTSVVTTGLGSKTWLVGSLNVSVVLGLALWIPVQGLLDSPFGIRLPWLATFPGRVSHDGRAFQNYDLSCRTVDRPLIQVGEMRGILISGYPVLAIDLGFTDHLYVRTGRDCLVSYTLLGGP